MPELSEQEMKIALAQARIMGCVRYTSCNNSMYFFDNEEYLRIRVRPGYDMWIGKETFPSDGIWQQGDLATLRKRYETKPPKTGSG